MKNEIIPTIFSHNKLEFNEKLLKLKSISKKIQIDIMDGKLVRDKSLTIKKIPNLNKYKNNFEAHLMVQNPIKYIKKLRNKGFKKIIFHYNTDDNIKTIVEIKKNKMKAFLAINPELNICDCYYLFQLLDGVLLMGVHPGKEHQKLINNTLNKIKEIKKISKDIPIQIDGGVNNINIRKLVKAGASIINTGSFVADSNSPNKSLKELKKELI